jgi:hypothetical protein
MEERKMTSDRVEETLNSLDGLQKASPGPFFYTRVMARMETEQQNLWESVTAFLTRPYVIATVISFILLLNATAIFRSDISESLSGQTDLSLVDEYQIASTSFYDYTNSEP